ncbi:MAG: hypothetical protein HS115_06885 [Spirochaetales bacterium]|nr:hypothetical protein [Spirochaetales bacterium]
MSEFPTQARLFLILIHGQKKPVPGFFIDTYYILTIFLLALAKTVLEKRAPGAKNAQGVEVSTYFYVQKLALQSAFEKILGRGGDKGSFARWVGDPPPDMASQVVTKAAGSAFSANMFERGLAIDMATAGSGELGSGSTRPGGAPAGFYVQLKWMDSWVEQEQNRHIADRQAGMNAPVWDTITDLLDPLIGMGYYQQMGRLENGPSTTEVAQASLMNLTSSLMKIGGAVMVVFGVATGWTGLGIGLAAGGAALIYAGNAIQADMKTGETSFKLTEAGAINATVSVGLSAAGGYFAGGTANLAEEAGKKAFEEALKTGATQAAAETAKAKAYEEVVKAAVLPTAVKMGGLGVATGAASAGLQYNSQQQLVGYKLGGKGTDAAFATAAMSGVASGALAYLGGSAFGANSSQFAQVYGNATMGFLGGKVGSDLASYATRQIYGAEFSSYDMLGQTGDWGGMVGLLGAWSQAANQQNQQQRQKETIDGAGYINARREQEGYTLTEADITRATDEATAIALSQGLGKGKWNDVNNGIRSLVNQGMDPASAAAAVLQGMGVDLRNVNPSAVQASYNLMHKEQQQALATAAWNKLSPEQQAAVFAGDPYNMTDAGTGLPAIGGVGAGTGSGQSWFGNKVGEWKDYFSDLWNNPGTTAKATLAKGLHTFLDLPLGLLGSGLNAMGISTPGSMLNDWMRSGSDTRVYDAAQARLAEGEMVGGFFAGAGGLVRGAVSGIRGLFGRLVTKSGSLVKLESVGDDLIHSILSKSGRLSQKQIDRLVSQARHGLVVKDTPSPQKLWQLYKDTGVEWGISDVNGVIKVFSGNLDSVLLKADKTTTIMQHVHPKNHLPSKADYKIWLNLRSQGAKLDTLDIVHKGELLRYQPEILEFLYKSGLLR